MLPVVGFTRPAMHLINVLLPLPDWPVNTVIPEESTPSAFTVTEGLAMVKENVIIGPPNYYQCDGTRTPL